MVQQGGQGALAEASAGLRGIAVALDQDRQRHPAARQRAVGRARPSCCCPSCRPGSSIMPGKVNPVLCESVNQVAARVFGNDATVGVRRVAGHPRAQHVPAGDGRRPARVGHAARQRVPGVRRQVRRRHRGRRGALPRLRRALVGAGHGAEPDHRLRQGRRAGAPGGRRAPVDHRPRRRGRRTSTPTRPAACSTRCALDRALSQPVRRDRVARVAAGDDRPRGRRAGRWRRSGTSPASPSPGP